MLSFIKTNKNLIKYSLIIFLIVPIFGINFLISFVSNILILLILVPLLFVVIAFLALSTFKSRIKNCNQCGSIMLGVSDECIYCGAKQYIVDIKEDQLINKPSETTIEIDAEEIK